MSSVTAVTSLQPLKSGVGVTPISVSLPRFLGDLINVLPLLPVKNYLQSLYRALVLYTLVLRNIGKAFEGFCGNGVTAVTGEFT